MSDFSTYLEEAKFIDRGSSVEFGDDYAYFKRLLENTNRRVNSIRPFFYAMSPLTISNAVANSTNFYSFAMLDDTTSPAVLVSTPSTPVVNTSVAYFGHLNVYFSPPQSGSTSGTWVVNMELNSPRNNDPAGGTNRVQVIGFDSTINPFTPQTFNSNNFPSINNWSAIDKFNTGDLDRILFHNFMVKIAVGAVSTYSGFFQVVFKGYQADLS